MRGAVVRRGVDGARSDPMRTSNAHRGRSPAVGPDLVRREGMAMIGGRRAAMQGTARGPTAAPFLLGFALSGFFDGVLLPNVIRWHHP